MIQLKIYKEKEILYIDNSPICLLEKYHDLATLRKNRLYRLEELFNKRCIIYKYFPDLQKDIDEALNNNKFEKFQWILKEIQYFLNDAQDCIYLRPYKVELTNFMENLVAVYKKELRENPDDNEKIEKIISRFFNDFEYHEFSNIGDDNPVTVVCAIKNEVLEYFGGSGWEQAEMYINDLNPFDREKLDFADMVEILHGFCLEYS